MGVDAFTVFKLVFTRRMKINAILCAGREQVSCVRFMPCDKT